MAASIHPRTYARRITRETDQPTHNIRRVSSPLEDLPTPTEDVSVEEMSRRMKKRSRQITSNAQDLPVSAGQSVEESISKHEPLSKKAKHLFEHNVDSLFDTPASAQVIPTTPSHGGKETLLPLATQRVNDSLFETPFPSEHSIFKSYVVPLADDPISPVPIGRRMLSRTTSRNFKENAAQARKFRKSLASPFNSRPASRSPSPVKTSRPSVKRTLHNKSRTLSSSSLKQHKKTSIGYNSAVTTEDSLFATSHTTNATTYQASVEGTVHALSHGRTASIPNVSSASSLLDNISAEDWLIPPKALTNNAHAQEDLHLDVFQADYPSFYFDQPNQVSTPSRRARQPMNALKNARPLDVSRTGPRSYYSDDSDAELVTAGPQASPRQTRRRRRTVVHMSSDSIFSSALDFSASSSEGPHAPGLPASQIALQSSLASPDVLSGSQNAVSVLDPAFSPASDYVSQYEDSAAKPTVPLLQSEAMLLAIPPTPGNKRSAGRLSPACDNPTESDDELYGMFSTLRLHDSAPTAHGADDSGVGLQSFATSSRLGRTKEVANRRKRGDTIRAADFARPSEPAEAVSPMQFSSRSSHVDILPPNTRRTRSGTVTLAKSAARPGNVAKPGTARTKVSRRPGGLPTIKMRIESPLPPQASDEEDDEMLIKHDTVWQEE